MTNIELVDALHHAIRKLQRVGEYSSVVMGVMANLQDIIDRTLANEMDTERMSDEPCADSTGEQPGDVPRDATMRRSIPLPSKMRNA